MNTPNPQVRSRSPLRQLASRYATCLAAVLSSFVASGAEYAIDWYSIDGGGVTSSSGAYAVSGSIGQPDAGMMTGGQYTLLGGFWGVAVAIQTPGAPCLSVTCSNGCVRISWPNMDPGWQLFSTPTLATTGTGTWSLIPPPYGTSGTNCCVTEPTPVGNRFYRLQKL